MFRLRRRDNAPGWPPKKSEFRAAAARLLCIPEEKTVIKTMRNYYYIFELTEGVKKEYGEDIFIKKAL